MDPVTLIVTALAAGASAGLSGLAQKSVQGGIVDLYERLKAAILAKDGQDVGAEKLLQRHARNPAGYEASVRDLVAESGAAADDALVDLARQLHAAAGAGAVAASNNTTISNSQGINVASTGPTHMAFYNNGTTPSEPKQ